MNRCSIIVSVMTFAASLSVGANLSAMQVSSTERTANQPAQTVKATAAPEETSGIAKGTTLVAEFSHGLNAKKLKAGDQVKAVLTQDLILKGRIVAPNESKLVGHVTEVKASTESDPESHLGVVFDKVILKHHQELPIRAEVQALLPPAIRRSRVDEPDQMMPPTVVAQGGSNSSGRGAHSSNSGPGPSTVEALNSIGATPTVQSTPGSSNPGSRVSTPDLSKVSVPNLSASNGMRGVYGIKNTMLGPPTIHPTLIVSKTSNVKLENGTQIILAVIQ